MKNETLRRYFGDMPPLDHYPLRDYREFRWEDSEVVEYIMSHPKFMMNLFYRLRKAKAIIYDQETRTWRGCFFEENNDDEESGCQNSPSKPFSHSTCRRQNPNTPPRGEGVGGVCDGRQTPDPLMTAAVNFDSDSSGGEKEVRDEPW